jgi:hypothetical protein
MTEFLLNKTNYTVVASNPVILKFHGDEYFKISEEQAKRVCANRNEGPKIVLEIKKARDEEVFAAAAAEIAANEPAPEPEVELKDLPLAELRERAKAAGGFPDGKDVDKASRRELLALLQP